MIQLSLPEEIFFPLFQEAALSMVLSDGKSLADAIPLLAPALINAAYAIEKVKPDFDMKTFLKKNFKIPEIENTSFVTDKSDSVTDHIKRLWHYLQRDPDKKIEGDTLIPLPYSYIVPGGRFNEIYYWDSYFTMLGLRLSGENDIISSMLENFSYLIMKVGFIPNGNRTYFLSRSQPPFFSMMVTLLAEMEGNYIYGRFLDAMQREYDFWMADDNGGLVSSRHIVKLGNDKVLNKYDDLLDTPRTEMYAADVQLARSSTQDDKMLYRHLRAACESGWDFSSRWCKDGIDLTTTHTCDILPVDLNCLLYQLEITLAKSYDLCGLYAESERMAEAAENRKNLILQYFWNEEKGYFYDYNFMTKTQTNIIHAGAVFPLSFKIVSDKNAARVLHNLEKHLLKPGGIVSTNINSGQQWDAPNGWAPLQWMSLLAARNYNHTSLAVTIAQRWTALNEKVLAATGKMLEKYNVENTNEETGGGEYPVQDGFGWTNGVYLAMKSFLTNLK